MAVGSPPTVRRRQLGRELRRLREAMDMRAEELAKQLRCSPSRVSRIETARIKITPGAVHEILDVLDIHGSERSRLVQLAKEAEEPGWWQDYTDALTYEYSTYIAMESEVSSLRAVEPIIIHGLLQTEDYARAIIEQGRSLFRSPAESDARLAARVKRRTLLTKENPPQLHIIMSESALRHVIGDREILRGQLQHLLELIELPNLTIQVLPFESADLLTFYPGPLAIMSFAGPSEEHVMYLESAVADVYVERPETVDRYMSIFNRMTEIALDRTASASKIKCILNSKDLPTDPDR